MISEIGVGLGSLKAAYDIAKGLNDLADTVAINEAKIALQNAIIEAQSSLLTAQAAQTVHLNRISELEARIAQLDAWENEKTRYQLQETSTGVLVYALKPNDPAGEPFHRLCPHCFQDNLKSILQTTARHGGGEHVECPRCNTKLKLSPFPQPRVQTSRSDYF